MFNVKSSSLLYDASLPPTPLLTPDLTQREELDEEVSDPAATPPCTQLTPLKRKHQQQSGSAAAANCAGASTSTNTPVATAALQVSADQFTKRQCLHVSSALISKSFSADAVLLRAIPDADEELRKLQMPDLLISLIPSESSAIQSFALKLSETCRRSHIRPSALLLSLTAAHERRGNGTLKLNADFDVFVRNVKDLQSSSDQWQHR
jgi:hypothetical protein